MPMLALALALQATPCPAQPVAPPAALAGWATPQTGTAGDSTAHATPLAPGRALRATLRPAATVTFAAPPAKDAGTGHAGLFTLSIAQAGRYRVALGSAGWIDLVRAGTPAASAAHAHGPACSGIRKMVDFNLAPGRYDLQLAGVPTAQVTLLVARLDAPARP